MHIDRRTLEIVRNPLLSPLRSIVTYELKLDEVVEIYDNLRPIKIFRTAEEALIKFRLSVMARAGKAEKIVQALADPSDSPAIRMLRYVEEAIRDESAAKDVLDPDGLAASIGADHEAWRAAIARRLADRVGFEVKIIFELPPAPARVVVLRRIEMRTRDAPNRMTSVVLHMTLESSGTVATNPLPVSDYERADRVREMLGTWFPESVTLYQLWFEKGSVEDAVAKALDVALKSSGQKIKKVLIDPVIAPAAREEQVKCTVSWSGHAGREVKFSIDAILKIRKDGAAAFDMLKGMPRKAWLEEVAIRALGASMNGLDFQDLNLATQRSVSADLKRQLRAAAEGAGQVMDDPLLTKIILAESKWLENAIVEIPPGRFKTKNSLVDAEFGIRLEVQFESLRPLIEHVHTYSPERGNHTNYNDLIEAEISKLATEAASAVMLETAETEYYADFEPWVFPDGTEVMSTSVNPSIDRTMTSTPGRRAPVKDRIQGAIIKTLMERLKPLRLGVILNRTDSNVTELSSRIQTLGRMTVSIDIEPLDIKNMAQILPITVVASSATLDATQIAAALRRSRDHLCSENVKDTMRLATREILQKYTLNEISSLNLGRSQNIFIELIENLNQRLLYNYGFSVQIESIQVARPIERTIRLEGASIGIIEMDYHNKNRLEQLSFQRDLHRLKRRELLDRLERLSRKLANNPRENERDINRHREDSDEYAALTRHLNSQIEEMKEADRTQFAIGSGNQGQGSTGADSKPVADDEGF